MQTFYDKLLDCVKRPQVSEGRWELSSCRPAWEGNATVNQFIAFGWEHENEPRLLAAVNFGACVGNAMSFCPSRSCAASKCCCAIC